jgi:plasmid stabilization system protein ParE
MAFELLIDYRAHLDVEEAIDHYISKSVKVADKLHDTIEDAYDLLETNPFFQVRYKDYRCLPLKGFPYMLHFSIDEKQNIVRIHALINTSKDPDTSWIK